LEENYRQEADLNVEALIFRSDESSDLIILEVNESVLRRLEANLPAKIIKKKKENSKLFKIEFEFDNLDFINQWLLQFGKEVKIESPNALVEKRKSLLKEMLNS
jgi:predicted DNA-binding transcriptional regulator YafY